MKNPFRRPTPTSDAATPVSYDPTNPPVSADGWDPKKMRDVVFATLATRIGPAAAQALREDFEHHLAGDPINGTEAAWICLTGKLMETIDRFNDLLSGKAPMTPPLSGGGADEPVSPFTTFRKDG